MLKYQCNITLDNLQYIKIYVKFNCVASKMHAHANSVLHSIKYKCQ